MNTEMTPSPAHEPGTLVVSTLDGEPGHILSAYARDAQGRWCEYEVETATAIEVWKVDEFFRPDQMPRDDE